jgi:hypothetical protein
LDVRVEEYIFELKGTGDLSCLKLVAHYYSDSEEEEDIAEHLAVMRRLRDERRRRARVIRSLPNEQCPNSEVTDELASRRELGLHPILMLTGAHFADEAVTENADRGSGFGRHGDVLVGMVTERSGRVVVGHRHGDGRIWA